MIRELMKTANYSFILTPDKRNECIGLPSFNHECYFRKSQIYPNNTISFSIYSNMSIVLRKPVSLILLGNMFMSVVEPRICFLMPPKPEITLSKSLLAQCATSLYCVLET